VKPDEITALINTSSIVLMPSRWREPFGLVALQAAQMSRPVVASAVGGLMEIVDHERTGYLVPSEDEEAWADAIARLISQPVLAQNLGQQARKRIQEKFSFDRMVDAYLGIMAEARKSTSARSESTTV
jgi:glycosyltransferase involved in cell wall biosynthesis